MGVVQGRTARPPTGPTVPVQARVPAEVRDAARAAADEEGISISAFIERLIVADANKRRRVPRRPRHTQDVLSAEVLSA